MTSTPSTHWVRLLIVTTMTLLAFAANSVLGRAALTPLADGSLLIDPISFTALRLVSGAAMLAAIVYCGRARHEVSWWQGSWGSAVALFGYAMTFSLAYLWLPAGTGALILFGLVQVTMYGWGIYLGERPGIGEWIGLLAASAGLVVLVAPGLEPPSPLGAVLMALAGVAWGIYSLRGRGQSQPVLATAGNFVRAAPLAVLMLPGALYWNSLTSQGVWLAIISGAVTSGLGYVLWYTALKGLTATRAALVQLSVPILAAVGGVVFLDEALTSRLILATLLVLGGIGLAVAAKARRSLPAKTD